MYIWGKGRAEGQVGSGQTFFVGNRGSGRVNVLPSRIGSKKSDPWSRGQLWSSSIELLFNNYLSIE